jgi:hypothetical protein
MTAGSATADQRQTYFSWLFSPPAVAAPSKHIILWWERRRLSYNLLVGATAFIAFPIYCIAIASTGILQPGEDIVEPIALMAPFAIIPINICYTAGWLVDAPLRSARPSLNPRFTVWLFALGCAFSVFVVSLPATFWCGYLLLQMIGVLH